MKLAKLVMILMVLGLFFGCASVIDEAEETEIDVGKLPLMFNPIDKDAERMLYEHMYSSPVTWNNAALNKVLTARGTLTMAEEYLDNKQKTEGRITFFTLREFLNFTMFAFTIYEEGADSRAYSCGDVEFTDGLIEHQCVLSEEMRWMYERVKGDVWTNLKSLRSYVDYMAAQIDGEVNAQTVERFKQAYKIVESIVPVKLPGNLDF